MSNNAVHFSNISNDSAISSKDQTNSLMRKRSSNFNKPGDHVSVETSEKKIKGQGGDAFGCCSVDPYSGFTGKNTHKPDNSGHQEQHLIYVMEDESTIPQTIPTATPKSVDAPALNKSTNNSKPYIESECSPLTYSR